MAQFDREHFVSSINGVIERTLLSVPADSKEKIDQFEHALKVAVDRHLVTYGISGLPLGDAVNAEIQHIWQMKRKKYEIAKPSIPVNSDFLSQKGSEISSNNTATKLPKSRLGIKHSGLTLDLSNLPLIICSTVFLIFFLLHPRIMPWADEWNFVLPGTIPLSDFIYWLFSQHNDHRIALQRILHISLLVLFDFDFRVLLIPSLILGIASAVVMVRIFRLADGNNRVRDAVIYFSLCSPWPNSFGWSSTFPFIAVNFGILYIMYYFSKLFLSNETRNGLLCYMAVFMLPFLGAGGIVAIALIGIVLLFSYILGKAPKPFVSPWSPWIWAIYTLGHLLFYTPSSTTGLVIDRVPGFFLGMSGGGIFFQTLTASAYGIQLDAVKDVFFACCLVAVTIFFIISMSTSTTIDKKQIGPRLLFFIVFGMVFSTILGRSAYAPWFPWLKAHYGIIAIPLVPFLFNELYKFKPTKSLATVVGLTVFVSYVVGVNWKYEYYLTERPKNWSVYAEIINADDPRPIISKHPKIFWLDDKPNVEGIARQIEELRRYGSKLYARQSTTP